jgi:hypothetical protein
MMLLDVTSAGAAGPPGDRVSVPEDGCHDGYE